MVRTNTVGKIKPEPEETVPTTRRRHRQNAAESWIAESWAFPHEVFQDTMKACKEELPELDGNERRALNKLESVWAQKLNSTNHEPDSNRRRPTPPPPRKRRCPVKPVAPVAPVAPPAEVEPRVENVYNVPDHVLVRNRIFMPPHPPTYRPRYFEVIMPAFVLKRRILDTFLKRDIINSLMASSDQEATAILQKLVEDVLKLKRCYDRDGALIEW